MVIACADSRVDPGMIFDAGPGELFIVRNIAALVPPYAPDSAYHGTSAAVEFAVRVLEIRDLVVPAGHGSVCRGSVGCYAGFPMAPGISSRPGSPSLPRYGRWRWRAMRRMSSNCVASMRW